MRQSFLLLLALMLYKFHVVVPMSTDHNKNIKNKYLNEKKTFNDLNDDCLHHIFDQLDFNDLMKMAQIDPKYAHITSYVFRQKYSNYEVQIANTKCQWYNQPCDIRKSPNTIEIRDIEIALNMMKYFGNDIRKLTVQNHSYRNYTSGSEWAMVNRIVNEYGSESLTQLKLDVISKELWPLFTVPFKKVEKLDIEIQTDTDGIKLNQLCPNLKELYLRLTNEANYDFIDCTLPHLEHLAVTWYGRRKDQIIGLIVKNPQIRSVDAQYTRLEFIKIISDYLPHLEILSLTFNDGESEPIHFENVKHCILYTSTFSTLTNLTFTHLESLQITYSSEEFQKYTEFFQRHRNLTRLNMLSIQNTPLQLDMLTASLDNLEEMIVAFYSKINVENVIKFIESHQKLKKFQFKTSEIDEADRAILLKRLERDWHIKIIVGDREALLIERI